MEITLYSAPYSSAGPVRAALAELDVPHTRVDLDLQKGESRTEAHLARNPNGKVPTLVVDGTPMFEAVAIMQWLGDRFGVARGLWPAADAPERLTAMAWSSWAYVTLGPAIYRMILATGERFPALESAPHVAQAKQDFAELVGLLDARLATQPWMLGASYSLVDLVVGCVAIFGVSRGAPAEKHAHVMGWAERLRMRPAIREAFGG